MVGLSVVLESHNSQKNSATSCTTKKTVIPLVINKANMVKPPPTHLPPPPANHLSTGSVYRNFHPPENSFLDACFLCRQRLLPGKDIYMYKGDKAFCSEECRRRQMVTDEYDEDKNNPARNYDNCSSAAAKSTEVRRQLRRRWINPSSTGKRAL